MCKVHAGNELHAFCMPDMPHCVMTILLGADASAYVLTELEIVVPIFHQRREWQCVERYLSTSSIGTFSPQPKKMEGRRAMSYGHGLNATDPHSARIRHDNHRADLPANVLPLDCYRP